MALNITPRAPANSGTQPKAAERPQVNYQPKPSSSRAEALKARLTGKPNPQPVAPRRAGSSARQEEFAALTKFPTGQQRVAPIPKPIGQSTARLEAEDFSNIAPPPSGLAPGQTAPQALSQITNSVETQGAQSVEANNEPLSPQFVALAKQAKQLRRAQQELKAEREAWKLEQAKYVPLEKLKSKTFETLTEAGITYDQLVESQLNQAAPDPNQVLLDRIAELEGKLNGVNTEFKKRDDAAYNAAVNQIRNDVRLLVDSDPAFETIKASDEIGQSQESGSEAVVDLIKRVFAAEGVVLTVEEAAKEVENKALEREFARMQRFNALSKIKARMAPPAEIPEEAIPLQQQPKQQTTLTNQGSVQRTLSARDRAVLAVKERMAALNRS